MAKQKNRKKVLKLEMKRKGLLKKASQVFHKAVASGLLKSIFFKERLASTHKL